MKVVVAFVLLCTTLNSFALRISNSVYRVDEVQEALEEAAEKEKPLTILYTNSKLNPV